MKKLIFKSLLLSTVMLFCLADGKAQDYKFAAGIRLGVPVSLSLKARLSEGNMFEAALGYRNYSGWNWTNISGTYSKYNSLEDVTEGLNWYYGGGASVYFWTYDDNLFFGDEFNNTSFGLHGTVGLDYKFPNKPFNVSIDYLPTYFFNSYVSGFGGGYGALAVRYTIGE